MSWLLRLVTLSLACAATCAPAAAEDWVDLVDAFRADPAPADTQVVPFGTDAARTLLGRGWARANEREKGATFTWAVGLRSELRIFAERPEDRVPTMPAPIAVDTQKRMQKRRNAELAAIF